MATFFLCLSDQKNVSEKIAVPSQVRVVMWVLLLSETLIKVFRDGDRTSVLGTRSTSDRAVGVTCASHKGVTLLSYSDLRVSPDSGRGSVEDHLITSTPG